MDGLFANCTSLSRIPNISIWDVQSLKHMNKIFFNCPSIVSFPNISIWNIRSDLKIDNYSFDSNSLINSLLSNDDGSQNSFSDNNKNGIYENINDFDKKKSEEKNSFYENFYS